MPFQDDQPIIGPTALPDGFDINPEIEAPEGNVLGAAFRLENPLVSRFNSFQYDRSAPFDPSYRPWEDIQGTVYEGYSDRFVEARNRDEVSEMMAQIDRELDDRRVVDAAGGWGVLAEITAGILTPSSLLPGGAVVKSAKGIRLGRSAMSVAGATGVAVAMDEISLQGSQQTRTIEESAFAIGGSVILGGMLGGGVAKLAKSEQLRLSANIETSFEAVHDLDQGFRSIGAAANEQDLTLRKEGLFQAIKRIPVVGRPLVGSDPLLRSMLHDFGEVRAASSRLAEPVLEYEINASGKSALGGAVPVETRIKTRRQNELAGLHADFARFYAEYSKDGPVGMVGRATAPLTGKWAHLLGYERKLSMAEFSQEVAKAMRRNDKHPIPQVQSVADSIRRNLFNPAKVEAEELGIFPEGVELADTGSYLTRSYNVQKIEAHLGDGSADDILPLLEAEFRRKGVEAENRLAFDSTVDDLESQRFRARETARSAQSALNKAERKAKAARTRADAAIGRERGVERVSGALAKALSDRAAKLSEGVLSGDELLDFKDILEDARGVKRIEPRDLLATIRDMGGIRDDGTGELKAALDTSLNTIKRADGLHPDDMRVALEELGFLPEGMTVNDFYGTLREAAGGQKHYSSFDAQELARFEAAQEFAAAMADLDIDISAPLDQIVKKLPGHSKSPKVAKTKAAEAQRAGAKAAKQQSAAEDRLLKAIDRLENSKARLKEIDKEIGPKVRAEIKQAQDELKSVLPELRKAKGARAGDEYFANRSDLEIKADVEDAVNAIRGLKPGQHIYQTAFAKPSRARVLDVSDELLEPWLESDARVVMTRYFESMVPHLEITREFGDVDMTDVFRKIDDEEMRLLKTATSDKQRKQIARDAKGGRQDLRAMRDRIIGTYGLPKDPRNGWVIAGRTARTVSYTGLLGGFMFSAMPDLGKVLGQSGMEAAFGAVTALTDPKRFGLSLKQSADLGAAAEWYLNGRAMEIANLTDPFGAQTKAERLIGEAGRVFSYAAGVIPWNAGWKTVGGAFVTSRMAKAAEAVRSGGASTKQIRMLAANGIEPWMAERIAKQVEAHGETDGLLWLPQGGAWDDAEAYQAFRNAMTREFDLMVPTPNQDRPLAFSGELGKFVFQFKTFAFSAHHRILLSGIQKADGDALATLVPMLALGVLVSNIRADQGGHERKQGAALWEDAIDRAGLAGWMLEIHAPANALFAGALSLSGEEISRYRTRSTIEGLLGPSFRLGKSVAEGIGAASRQAAGTGKISGRDVDNLTRAIPGNNLWYLMPLFQQIEDEMAANFGN